MLLLLYPLRILGGDQYGAGKTTRQQAGAGFPIRKIRFDRALVQQMVPCAFFDQPVHEGCHVVVCMFPRVGIRLPSGRIVHGPAALREYLMLMGAKHELEA